MNAAMLGVAIPLCVVLVAVWPMFRGDPGLRGVAEGGLPTELELPWDLSEARVVVEDYRRHYNHSRPHSKLGYPSPVRFAAATNPPSSPPVGFSPPCSDDGQTHNPNLN